MSFEYDEIYFNNSLRFFKLIISWFTYCILSIKEGGGVRDLNDDATSCPQLKNTEIEMILLVYFHGKSISKHLSLCTYPSVKTLVNYLIKIIYWFFMFEIYIILKSMSVICVL